jgi:hypothetical protein
VEFDNHFILKTPLKTKQIQVPVLQYYFIIGRALAAWA